MLTGTYLPGDTPVHRAAPGRKVGLLAAFMVALVALGGPVPVIVGAVLVAGGYALARVCLLYTSRCV